MKITKKKSLLFVTSALAGLSLTAAVAFSMQKTEASAATSTGVVADMFEMHYGASIRTKDYTGMRFQAKFGSELYNELTAANTTSELHVAIIPYTYYDAYEKDTTENKGSLYQWLSATYGVDKIIDIKMGTDKFHLITEDGQTSWCANAVISNIKFNNYHVEFVGAAYIQRGTSGNYTYQDVTGITEEANARSVFEVACKAYADPEDYAKHGEFLEDMIEKGMYSAYGVEYDKTTDTYTYNGETFVDYEAVTEIVDVSKSTVTLDEAYVDISVDDQKTIATQFNFVDGTEFAKDAYLTWTTSDADVATVDENGVITAVGVGEATLTASVLGGKFSADCKVNVFQKVVDVEGVLLAQGNGTRYSYDTGAANVDLSGVEADLNNVTSVLLDGEPFANYTASGSTLTLNNAPGGDHAITITTDKCVYNAQVCVYVNGISTVEELEEWRNKESYWYTVLLNDIDYNGATLAVGANVLNTWDGRGYSIKNFTYTQGFVKNMYDPKSVFKNVKFVGATQDCTGMGKYPAYGLFGQWTKGTLENVYIDVTTTNMDEGAEHIATVCYGLEASGTARNVVVDIKNANGNFHYAINQNNGGTVVGIVGGYESEKSSEGAGAPLGVNSGFHKYISWMVAEEANDELLSFTSPYWHIDATARTINLLPLGGVFETVDGVCSGAIDGDETKVNFASTGIDASTISKIVCNGEEIAFTTDGNVVSLAGAEVAKKALTVITSDGTYYTVLVNAVVMPERTVEGTYYNVAGQLDLTGSDIDLKAITGITCGGEEVAFTVDGNAVMIAVQTYGETYEYVITTKAEICKVNVVACDKLIWNIDDLEDWREQGTYAYAILMNNIDCEGATLLEGSSNYRTGVLDGQGYAVVDFTITKGFVQNLGATGVIKNLQLLKVTQDCTFAGDAAVSYGVLGRDNMGTIENVLIKANLINVPAKDHYGIIYMGAHDGSVMRNVVAYIESTGTANHYAGPMWRGEKGTWTIENLKIVSGASIYMYDYQAAQVEKFATKEEMHAAVDFSSWAEPWTTDENGAPMMKEVEIQEDETPGETPDVEIQEVTVSGTIMAQGNGGKWSYATGAANVDLSGVEANLNNVTKVLLDGEEFADYTASGSTLTLNNAPGGDHTLTITTDTHIYNAQVCVYAIGISTVEELDDWRFSSGYGYTVLLNDIDYEGATLATPAGTEQILGTLDGRGYAIKNFTHTKGYVGGLYGADSAIKNVKFVGVKQDCTGMGKYPAYGLFAQSVQGTIENVYIDLTTTNMDEGAEHLGVIVYAMKSGSTARNVVVDLKNASGNFHYAFNQNEGGTVVGVVGGYEGTKGSSEGAGAAWGVDGGFHPKLSWMVAEEANDELLTFTSPYWHIDATARTIDLKPLSALAEPEAPAPEPDPEEPEMQEVDIAEMLFAKGNAGKYSYATGAANVDLSGVEANLSNVTKVLLDGEEFADYTASGSTLTLNNAPGGDHLLTITTDTHIYNAQVCVYVNGISTVAELESWRTTESYWYTVLLNDIDYAGATLTGGANVLNTLDGRGYTIKNFTTTGGFINRLYDVRSAIKNVKFTGVTQDCSTWTGGVDRGVLGQWNNGTLENVYLQVHTTNVVKEHYGVLCFGMNTGSVIKNVVVEITSDSTLFHYVMLTDNALADGNSVGVVGSYVNGSTESQQSAWGVNSGFHQQLSWMVAEEANDELLTFTSAYWHIDATARTIDLKPWGELKSSKYLARNGETDYAILVDASEESKYQTAIAELQALFKEATGAELPVVTTNVAYSSKAQYISLGNTNAFITSEIGMAGDLGDQGYQITTKGKSIFIIGESKGVLYGVYELMHELFGFEQYTTEYYYIDQFVAEKKFQNIDKWDVPDIEYRIGVNGEQRSAEAQVRDRMRIMKSEDILFQETTAHNMLKYIVPYDTYKSTKKNLWFSNQTSTSSTAEKTQLCYTARGNATEYAAMVDVAVSNIMAILNAKPSISVFSLTQMDVQNMWCTCTACKALQTTYGTAAASQIFFINEVTAKVAAQLGDRKVQFMTFAYLETVTAPVTDNGDGTYTAINGIKLNDNVSIWIAPIGEEYTSESAHENIDTLLAQWSACADSCFIWAYNVYFHNYLVAYDTYDYIDDLVQVAVEHNAKYFWAQGSWDLTRSTGFDDLKSYLFAKLMWDSTLDVDTLIDEFFAKVYGAAGDTMRTVFENWRTQSAKQNKNPGGNSVKSIYEDIATLANFPLDWINSQIDLLNDAAALVDAGSVAYDAIQCEIVMYKYLLLELTPGWQRNWSLSVYRSRYPTDYKAWQAALAEFKTMAETYGFNQVKEGTTGTLDKYLAVTDKS